MCGVADLSRRDGRDAGCGVYRRCVNDRMVRIRLVSPTRRNRRGQLVTPRRTKTALALVSPGKIHPLGVHMVRRGVQHPARAARWAKPRRLQLKASSFSWAHAAQRGFRKLHSQRPEMPAGRPSPPSADGRDLDIALAPSSRHSGRPAGLDAGAAAVDRLRFQSARRSRGRHRPRCRGIALSTQVYRVSE